MSCEPEDEAMLAVAKHEARKLAASSRSLAQLCEEQHYSDSRDVAAVLEHVAQLLDQVAGGYWDRIECQDATSIAQLRGDICSVRATETTPHGGLGALRQFPTRSGRIVKLWMCESCFNGIANGVRPTMTTPAASPEPGGLHP